MNTNLIIGLLFLIAARQRDDWFSAVGNINAAVFFMFAMFESSIVQDFIKELAK